MHHSDLMPVAGETGASLWLVSPSSGKLKNCFRSHEYGPTSLLNAEFLCSTRFRVEVCETSVLKNINLTKRLIKVFFLDLSCCLPALLCSVFFCLSECV